MRTLCPGSSLFPDAGNQKLEPKLLSLICNPTKKKKILLLFYAAEILITFITQHYCSWYMTNTPCQSKSHMNMLSLWFSESYYSLSSIISLSNVFDLMFIKDFIETLSVFKERLFYVSQSQNLLVSRWHQWMWGGGGGGRDYPCLLFALS